MGGSCRYEEYTYLLIKVDALDHKKRVAREKIRIWHTRESKWYSSNSKSTQIVVTTPSTPPEIFLFLQRKISAAAKRVHHKLEEQIDLNSKRMHTRTERISEYKTAKSDILIMLFVRK